MTEEAKTRMQEIARVVKAATVAIVLFHPSMPEQNNRPFTIIGSGFCVHHKGIVVTCKHVIDEFIDPENSPPRVIFYHPNLPGHSQLYINVVPVRQSIFGIKSPSSEDILDLALLRIDPPGEGYEGGYPVIPVARYEDIYEIMDVVTCGFPLGDYLTEAIGSVTSSFSKGIVSSIIPWPGATQDKLSGFQLDLRVAKGNSGGPVISLTSGHVFGVLRRGVEQRGIQLLAKAEPIYPILAHGLIERILQGVPHTASPEVT